MDASGRDELRKAYEELADEILIDIARNVNTEYEQVAVEVAEMELRQRGVDIPVLEMETEGGLELSGELEGPLVEIPRFSEDESAAIDEILAENRIPYEKQAVASVSCSGCGCSEYVYFVQEKSFTPAVEILRDYYLAAIEAGSSNYFSGECPACGTGLNNVEKCTDCGLTLAGDISGSLKNHPFMRFLESNNLMS